MGIFFCSDPTLRGKMEIFYASRRFLYHFLNNIELLVYFLTLSLIVRRSPVFIGAVAPTWNICFQMV